MVAFCYLDQGETPHDKTFRCDGSRSFALVGAAMAQGTCESRAVDKNAKALVGAAKTSFLTTCRREACEPKAVKLKADLHRLVGRHPYRIDHAVFPSAQVLNLSRPVAVGPPSDLPAACFH